MKRVKNPNRALLKVLRLAKPLIGHDGNGRHLLLATMDNDGIDVILCCPKSHKEFVELLSQEPDERSRA